MSDRWVYISVATVPSRTANSIHVMKMCQAIERQGVSVELIIPKRGSLESSGEAEIWQRYGIRKPFGIRSFHFSSFFRFYDYALRATLYARSQKVNLVFTRHLPSAFFSTLFKVPTVLEIHEGHFSFLWNLLFRVLIRTQELKKIVVISSLLKSRIEEVYPYLKQKNSVMVLPDCVDLDQFKDLPSAQKAKAGLSVPENRQVLGYCGHLYPGRGVELILDLAETETTKHFLLIGGTEQDLSRWKDESRKRNLSNVQFLGFIPQADVPRALAACDVLLMPFQSKVSVSHGSVDTSSWMSPMKMFEYMASERPIISSDLPALREVLDPSVAYLCPPEDRDAWKEAIRQIDQNPRDADQKSKMARKKVENFTWDKRVQNILQHLL